MIETLMRVANLTEVEARKAFVTLATQPRPCRARSHALLPKLILEVRFTNGLEVIAEASDLQAETAAA